MIQIQKLRKSDIQIVQTLAKEIWNEHYRKILSQEQIEYMLDLFYSTEKIQEEISNGYSWELVFYNSLPVGFMCLKFESEKVHLSKIYLHSDVRGKGLGKELIQHAIELAQEKNYFAIYLNVNKYNTDSIEFYKRLGFQIIEEGVFDIGNGYVMDDYIMEKNI